MLVRTLSLILMLVMSLEAVASSAKRKRDEEHEERTSSSAPVILKGNPYIAKIDLVNDKNLTNIEFIRFFPNLTELNLYNCFNLKDNYYPISQLVELKKLTLFGINFTTARYIKPLVNLAYLKIECPDVGKAMKYIVKLKKLKKLDISGEGPMGLEKISQLVSLEKLTIRDVLNNDDHKDDFVYPTLDFISHLTNLRELDLSGNDYVFYIHPIVKLQNLTILNLSSCHNIRDLRLIKKLRSLIKLDLDGIDIVGIPTIDSDLVSLKKLPNLRALTLSNRVIAPSLSKKVKIYKEE